MTKSVSVPHPSRIDSLLRSSQGGCEEINSLTERLEEFYNTTHDYTAFNAPDDRRIWLRVVAGEIGRKFRPQGAKIRVLEIGAGCGSVFQEIECLDRRMFHYTAQDITKTTLGQLRQVADAVHIGPLRTLAGPFDVIFSLFVLEHIATPGKFLANVDRLLTTGGTHVVVCPRYDIPGYVCPSMRHLPGMQLFWIEAERHVCNALGRFGGEPSFWVNTDPALFHKKWRRDADAVHIVCQNELVRWHSRLGYGVRKLSPRILGFVDFFFKRLATVHLAFDKPKRLSSAQMGAFD